MTNFVEQINDAIKVRVAAVLGSDYSEMAYVLAVEMNNERNSVDRYGVHPLSASNTTGPLNLIAFDQAFEIVLMDQFKNRDSDLQQRETTFVLYDKMDAIIQDLMHTKIGLSSIVTLVHDPAIGEPEYPDNEIAVLRGIVIIKWRRAT